MYIRRVKRKCGIRGCKNTDCFAISRAREIGYTVIMCRDCLKEALEAVEALPEGAKTNKPEKQATEAPPLFFSDVLKKKSEEAINSTVPKEEGGKSENRTKNPKTTTKRKDETK